MIDHEPLGVWLLEESILGDGMESDPRERVEPKAESVH